MGIGLARGYLARGFYASYFEFKKMQQDMRLTTARLMLCDVMVEIETGSQVRLAVQ